MITRVLPNGFLAVGLCLLSVGFGFMAHLLNGDGHRRASAATVSPDESSTIFSAKKRKSRHRSPVGVTVTVGYQDRYRPYTLVPVRVRVHNRTSSTISGQVSVPTALANMPPYIYYPYAGQPVGDEYDIPLVLPPDEAKQVTTYLPASALPGSLKARFLTRGRVIGTGSAYTQAMHRATLSFGVLTSVRRPPASWMTTRIRPGGRDVTREFPLTPQTFDAVPEALANMDAIVIKDGTSSALSPAQFAAVGRYVNGGGCLVLVGGPGWQQTLRPIPPSLIPGKLSGDRTVSGLGGLTGARAGQNLPESRGATLIAVLRHVRGEVLASQGGIPLAVDDGVGRGHIIFLAFDPSFDPIAHWPAARRILTRLLLRGLATAAAGVHADSGITAVAGRSSDLGYVLQDIPSPARSAVLLFFALAAISILLLGPTSYVVLRRLKRDHLMWVTVPAGGLLCLGATFFLGTATRATTTVVNTVGVVQLAGSSAAVASHFYVGVFAPLRGDYQLALDSSAYPEIVPSSPGSHRARFQEGPKTTVDFPGMDMWSMRMAGIATDASLPGTVQARLHVTRAGHIAGWVRNGTKVSLLRPSVIAGGAVTRLPDMAPRARDYVDMVPGIGAKAFSRESVLAAAYAGKYYLRRCYAPYCFSFQPRHAQAGLHQEIAEVASQLPMHAVASLSEVEFAAWSTQPLLPLRVEGVSPQRRDLNLIVRPLSVRFTPGPFILRAGTFGPSLIDVQPRRARSTHCCVPPGPSEVGLGPGGTLTYRWSLPAHGRLGLTRLRLRARTRGLRSLHAEVWAWPQSRWVTYDLSNGAASVDHAGRFVSSQGFLVVRIVNTDSRRIMLIRDPHLDLQISGRGTFRWASTPRCSPATRRISPPTAQGCPTT